MIGNREDFDIVWSVALDSDGIANFVADKSGSESGSSTDVWDLGLAGKWVNLNGANDFDFVFLTGFDLTVINGVADVDLSSALIVGGDDDSNIFDVL